MTTELTLVQTTTVRVELQGGRVRRLVDITDEPRTLEGFLTARYESAPSPWRLAG